MTVRKKIYVGSDHGGYAAKMELIETLRKELPELVFEDLGSHSDERCDYPDFAKPVAEKVAGGKAMGLLICGSGIGMSIAANKVSGIRAAVVWDVTSAKLSREHNNANILCLGGRLLGSVTAHEMAKIWLSTEFKGERHEARLAKIEAMEKGD